MINPITHASAPSKGLSGKTRSACMHAYQVCGKYARLTQPPSGRAGLMAHCPAALVRAGPCPHACGTGGAWAAACARRVPRDNGGSNSGRWVPCMICNGPRPTRLFFPLYLVYVPPPAPPCGGRPTEPGAQWRTWLTPLPRCGSLPPCHPCTFRHLEPLAALVA